MMYFIDKVGKTFDDFLLWLKYETWYAVDTETTGLDPHSDKILLLQFGNAKTQWVLDTYRLRKNLSEVLSYLEDPNKIKIFHNAQFDYKMILGNYGIKTQNIKCTLLLEQLLTKGKISAVTSEKTGEIKQKKILVGLASVAKKYLNVNLDKQERLSFVNMVYGDKFTKEQLQYAGLDTAYLIDIYQKQMVLIENKNMLELANLEFAALPVFGDMSFDGIFLDPNKWLPLEKKAIKQLEAYEQELNSYFTDIIEEKSDYNLFGKVVYKINYNSPKQTLPLLKKVTGVDLESTEADYLEQYSTTHPAIQALVNYKKEQKKITTYGSPFLSYIHPTTHRIHSDFKQIHADTGRTSSENPKLIIGALLW